MDVLLSQRNLYQSITNYYQARYDYLLNALRLKQGVASSLFPERTDLEICGDMAPAAKVGGDFFDVFFVDDSRLFFKCFARSIGFVVRHNGVETFRTKDIGQKDLHV